mmetsp:Transcript_11890/g.21150  ORF Transcript_11890/g.21150 Transcript_11890/m.21150 type:complete len:150 (+) Transcript_11890:273-722(+)|eukprot:CAMPEP_0201888820 /NCGR_PEP_ID=MMETSP0902-20130614/28504_1 /ASSEMBLY_ACC=CAM_ASM_000551 /TAXON_ID=420261 /ORGANISM="Thalassiosira antarctica, Strain CCMP982" /LENGTH=149 /DNA_ID=CAMNT_0048419191 /DNA_START=165 /DNA_END=614 /DNA_ORIENTATION=+
MSNSNSTTAAATSSFAKHVLQNNTNNDTTPTTPAKMSLLARFLIFLFIPCFTGLSGYGISHLQSLRNSSSSSSGEPQHVVDFDRDFVTPFLLALALVVVVGFQTSGFSNGDARKGAFSWPKARKVQRIRRERVVVDDDDDDDHDKKKDK